MNLKNINIKVNDTNIVIQQKVILIQALALYNIEIPRFCFNENLSVAGNCRMCLVEIKNNIKPVASCAVSIYENMEVYTNTKLVKQARESVLELLLANHPLDCPICDQGGECDLQDQSLVFGTDRNRFYEAKRAVSDKSVGPAIKMIMTRCIHCTKCVRFLDEIANCNDLGVINRGNSMEINTYIQNNIDTELSGNIIDLCPVGALTSKLGAFEARPWELKSYFTWDFFDTMSVGIRVDLRGLDVIRVTPNVDITNSWISDKTRFFYDLLNTYRDNEPFILKNYRYVKHSWKYTINYLLFLFKYINLKNIIFNTGNFLDLQSLNSIKNYKKYLNTYNIFELSYLDRNKKNNIYELSSNSFTIFSDFINCLEESNLKLNNTFFIGCNIRNELPLLNAKIRKYFLTNKLSNFFNIGFCNYYSFKTYNIGTNLNTILKLFKGSLIYNQLFFNNFLNKINFLVFGLLFMLQKNNKIIKFMSNFSILLKKKFNINLHLNYLNSNLTILNSLFFGSFNYMDQLMKKNIYIYNNTENKFNNTILYYLNSDLPLIYKFLKKDFDNNFIRIYQGVFFDYYSEILLRRDINIIMPTGDLFDTSYNSNNKITYPLFLDIVGNVKQFNKFLYKNNIIKSIKDTLDVILCLYFNVSEFKLQKLNNIFPNFNENNYKFFNYNELFFEKLGLNKYKTNFRTTPLKNYFYNFYKMDIFGKLSLNLNFCARFLKKRKFKK